MTCQVNKQTKAHRQSTKSYGGGARESPCVCLIPWYKDEIIGTYNLLNNFSPCACGTLPQVLKIYMRKQMKGYNVKLHTILKPRRVRMRGKGVWYFGGRCV